MPHCLLVVRTRQAVEKLLLLEVRHLARDLFLVRPQRHLRHVWNQRAHGVAKRADGQVFVRQHIFQLHSVHHGKHPFKQVLGNFETDEVVILLRRVALLGDLRHVESEFRANVRGLVLRVKNNGPEFGAKLGIGKGDRLVHGRMAGDVRCVMGKRSQRKGILVGVLAFLDELQHKIAAAHVVHQVAELLVAEGIVAHVLDHRTAIRIGMRLPHLVVRQPGIPRQDHRPQLIVPQQIDDLFMREHGICVRRSAADQQEEQYRNAADGRTKPASSGKYARAE